MIRMDGLRVLYRGMRQLGIERYKMEHRHGRVSFAVMFMTDKTPFGLLFGARGTSFSFHVDVHAGFRIDTKLDGEDFIGLCDVLGLTYDPNNPFSTSAFFAEFDRGVPNHPDPVNVPRLREIAALVRDTEDTDKPFFLGWRDNNIRNERVTEKNLEKTKRVFKQKRYEQCKRDNLSSCWTSRGDTLI